MEELDKNGLTIAGYIRRIDSIISKLNSADSLLEYPAMTRLLDSKTKGNTKRQHLIELLEFMKEALPQADRAGTLEKEKHETTGQTTAYRLSISESKLAELWGMGKSTVVSLSLLFADTMLINRQTAKNKKTLSYFEKNATPCKNSQNNSQNIIYAYWVDAWTPGQLQIKEARAQEWINIGHPAKIRKHHAITMAGQSAANAITQSGATKAVQQLLSERRTIEAYEAITRRTGREIVVKAELLREIEKRLSDKKTWYNSRVEKLHGEYNLMNIQKSDKEIRAEARRENKKRLERLAEKCWREGKASLLKEKKLDFRQLTREEKQEENITDVTCWALIPHK